MTTKERLHELVDKLADGELDAAECALKALTSGIDPVSYFFDHATEDDEPLTQEEQLAIREARAAYEAADYVKWEDVRKELGRS